MRARLLAALVVLASAGTAEADVIEISDGGEAHILGLSSATAGKLGAVSDETSVDDPFEHAARRHGIDVGLLRAVAWTESRGRSDAVSPKGARGVMQLMPATAAELGVDPRDPRANINGGAAYLARQLATFRDVPLALAAYNAGPGAVTRYRGVPPYAETRNYVASIMRRWSGPASPVTSAASSGFALGAGAADAAVSSRHANPLPIMLIEVPGP